MSQSEDHNTTTTTTSTDGGELEQSLRELVALGRVWASYGLNAGKEALETCSRTHSVAARFLGELADHVKPERPDDAS